MHTFWTTVFYQPIYNTLIFIIGNITLGDVGFAIIILTIIIKLILSPLTQKSIKSQLMMKRMEPEIKRIKKEYPNKEEQAKKTFEIYKKYGTNPFSGCLVVLLQLPVLFALYSLFRNQLPVDNTLLYGFIHMPEVLHTHFLGLVDIHSKSLILALLAGITQFIQGYLSTPKTPKVEVVKEMPTENEKKSFQDELSSSMQTNVKYMLPIFMAFIAYQYSATIALYLITSTLFTIGQEWYIRKTLAKTVLPELL
jgi:YidC/Oxa1 family membrane protein insertase